MLLVLVLAHKLIQVKKISSDKCNESLKEDQLAPINIYIYIKNVSWIQIIGGALE